MSSNLHRNSTEANKHTPKGFDLADNNSTLLRDERGQSRYIDNLVNERVENLVDGFNAPPTTTSGHLYVLIDEGSGTVNTDWNGANYNDIVRIQDGVWVNITPVNGYLVFNKTDEKYYKFGSSGWVEFIPESENIYTNDGTIGSNRVATLTDTLSFSGGRVSFDTTTNGILLPRLTTVQMNGISSPATNLLIYNTDLNGLYRYNGSSWVALSIGYGIIGVYSGSGNGTPVFFADLQSALETCKASGGYFTVKLYSNITITSAIQIEYTGSGVGNAYQFRQLTIDFNGFSVTNAQANTSDAFDVRLSNNVAVYQELRFINGVVLRTNGTGTHHALNATASARIGTIQMQNMLFYCQNSISIFINLGISTAVDAKIENDFGNSTFISLNNHAVRINNTTTTIKNFKAISSGNLFSALFISQGKATNFNAEGLLNANGIAISNNTTILDFYCSSNTFTALLIEGANIIANNFRALSNSGRGIDAPNSSALISNFIVETGNNFAINSIGNSEFSNGKCRNNSLSQTAFIQNFNSVHELECTNLGGGVGLDVRNHLNGRGEVTMCKSVSIGGVAGIVITSGTSNINCSKCDFISRWNNAGGHGVWAIAGGSSKVQITFANLSVLNSSANAIFSDVATTIHSRYCTHNNVASTPVNANVTIVSSGIIS